MERIRALNIAAGGRMGSIPVSFVYNGVRHTGLPGCESESRLIDANITETTSVLRLDDTMTVTAVVTAYRDYPVTEWVLYFRNEGTADSAMLENVWAADLSFSGATPRLVVNNGDTGRIDGYTDSVLPLPEGADFTQRCEGGRPCENAFPYQRLLFDHYGYMIAIGWPGQWNSRWKGSSEGAHLWCGQETVHTVLHPHECFRTPRMCVMGFDGSVQRGINLWRRWYFSHVMPRTGGHIFPQMVHEGDNGGGIEYTETTETQQVEAIGALQSAGIKADFWWIDAGWYPCLLEGKPLWQKTGTWKPDPERYPNGLKPVSDAAHASGMKLLVWFEPERVHPESWLAGQHPEWMLRRANPAEAFRDRPENMLLNLGDPACLKWLIDHMVDLIRQSGIDIYRQDFNIRPLPFWRENEAPDRQGMLENQYLQGYLAYWNALKLAFPDLMIDSCASGGRRNDLESMRLAVPFHQTDFGYGHHPTKQKYARHFYSWIPYFRGFSESWDKQDGEYAWPDFYEPSPRLPLEEFDLMNSIAPIMSTLTYRLLKDKPEAEKLQKEMIALCKTVQPQLRGDFYPLGDSHCDAHQWSAWQFYTPEKREGLLQFFRNTQAEAPTFTARLCGLTPERSYLFRNPRSGESRTVSGAVAMESGFVENLPARHASLWLYRELD